MYIYPGAGSNFIAWNCLWNADVSSKLYIKEGVNEYLVPRQKSTLWDCNSKKSSGNELTFAETYPELKKYWDVWNSTFEFSNGWIDRFSLSQFFRLMQQNNVSLSAYEVLTRDYFWLPIFDYSIYYGLQAGKSEQLDGYCKHLMDMCWEIHEKENKDLMSIVHYHPGLNFKGYDYSTDIKTLCLSINECEDYISDLLAIKHSVQDPYTTSPPTLERLTIRQNDFEIQKSDIIVEYKKVFFDNNPDEIRKLYEFFENEDYFDKNRNDIMTIFKQYHNSNLRISKEFDWGESNIVSIPEIKHEPFIGPRQKSANYGKVK
tara:strand:- start:293 stop:1243 length:951 start_codon:yes stop_codon:yes gene_type:complete